MIRASTLEQFRRILAGETSDGEEALIRDIKAGQNGAGNERMDAGTAWHRCLSLPEFDLNDLADWKNHYLIKGKEKCVPIKPLAEFPYFFDLSDVQLAREFFGPGRHEVPGFGMIGGQQVCCTADLINGLVVSDAKTKFTTINAADYETSLQWRIYLHIHGARQFRYCLFRMTDPNDDGFIRMMDMTEFSFFSYPEMQNDLTHWVNQFMEWCDSRRLTQYLSHLTARSYLNRS